MDGLRAELPTLILHAKPSKRQVGKRLSQHNITSKRRTSLPDISQIPRGLIAINVGRRIKRRLAVHTVLSEPVSAENSMLAAKIQGKITKCVEVRAFHANKFQENSGLRAISQILRMQSNKIRPPRSVEPRGAVIRPSKLPRDRSTSANRTLHRRTYSHGQRGQWSILV